MFLKLWSRRYHSINRLFSMDCDTKIDEKNVKLPLNNENMGMLRLACLVL